MDNKPPSVNTSTYCEFMCLPQTDNHCKAVDKKNGLWYDCNDCDEIVKSREDRPYTLGRWYEHKKFKKHIYAVAKTERRLLASRLPGNLC